MTSGSLLKEAVHDVSRLLVLIVEHQRTLTTAISENLRLISLSEDLRAAVQELSNQNRRLIELVKEAENAGLAIAA